MNITDQPMPSAAPLGFRFYALLCQKDGKIVLHEARRIYRRDHAIAKAKDVAAEGWYASVVVIDATIIYRVWDRDQLKDIA